MSRFSNLRSILAAEGLNRKGTLDLHSPMGADVFVKAVQEEDVDTLFGLLKDDPDWYVTIDDMRASSWARDFNLSWEARKSVIKKLDMKLSKFFSEQSDKEIAGDPDKKFLGVLRDLFTVAVTPSELGQIVFKEYKNFVRLEHKGGDWIPDGNVAWRDLPQWMKQNGIAFKTPEEARLLFVDFLKRRAKGGTRRPPARRMAPPLYD